MLTLVAAGHPAGFYQVNQIFAVRTLGTGSFTPSLAFTMPLVGASTVTVNAGQNSIALTSVAVVTVTAWVVYSDGSTAITLQQVPTGVAATNPVVDIYASAALLAA